MDIQPVQPTQSVQPAWIEIYHQLFPQTRNAKVLRWWCKTCDTESHYNTTTQQYSTLCSEQHAIWYTTDRSKQLARIETELQQAQRSFQSEVDEIRRAEQRYRELTSNHT